MSLAFIRLPKDSMSQQRLTTTTISYEIISSVACKLALKESFVLGKKKASFSFSCNLMCGLSGF